VGGGIVIVPVLYHLFTSLGVDEAVRMHVAVGTSLATIVATSMSSIRAHWRRDAVDIDLLKSWGPWIVLGVIVGTVIAGDLKGPALSGVFGSVALVVAVYMGLGSPKRAIADRLPGLAGRAGLGCGIGGISAMMGIGGGTLSVPTLTLFSVPIHRAVGTASAIGFLIGLPGAIGFALTGVGVEGRPPFCLGYVSLLGLALILPTSVAMAPVGARLAHSLDTTMLRRVFAVFLAFTALRMIYSLIW